jgi:hypothetical protein
MDKIKLLFVVYLLSTFVGASNLGRWAKDDYKYFCAETARDIFGWTYDNYYNTDITNATNCVLYPYYGFPDDFWVSVPTNIDDRERCLFKYDCPARAWASEWFNMSFKQTQAERQVCGYCISLYYALHDLERTLPDNATNADVLKAVDRYSWGVETVATGQTYCVEGECAFSCRKAVDLNVLKCEQRKDRECEKKLGYSNVSTPVGVVCPICEKCFPSVECRKCPDCQVCETCQKCEDCAQYQVEIKDLKNTIDSLNEELIFYKERNISTNRTDISIPSADRTYILVLAVILFFIVIGSAILMR